MLTVKLQNYLLPVFQCATDQNILKGILIVNYGTEVECENDGYILPGLHAKKYYLTIMANAAQIAEEKSRCGY